MWEYLKDWMGRTHPRTLEIGVDCGLDGGIVIDTNDSIECHRMPLKNGTLDDNKIMSLFFNAKLIVIEQQFILKHQGNKGNFTIGTNYGKLLALANISGAKVVVVHPLTWQGGFDFRVGGAKKTKTHHIRLAQNMGLATGHDGVADAFLILRYQQGIEEYKASSLKKKVDSALAILRNAVKDHGDDLCLSLAGADSTIINDLIYRYNIRVPHVYTNYSVETTHNRKLIKRIIKSYEHIHIATAPSYAQTVWKYGFPIQNKEFSTLCYRVRKVDEKNARDVFRVICGSPPSDVEKGVIYALKNYHLPLKFWNFALNNPVQSECCRILKKAPAKKVGLPMIIGIMADDSMARKIAIKKGSKNKIYPLAEWNKDDIFEYAKVFNVELSETYHDRKTKGGEIVCGAKNSGCPQCHYGQSQGHYHIKDDERTKTTKFENLNRESPRLFNATMEMKHKSGKTFRDVLTHYSYVKGGMEPLELSVEARNKYVVIVCDLLMDEFPLATKYLMEKFYL